MDNGRATGIKLMDGTEVTAKQLVVSDNASPQLFLRLIGEDRITEDMKRKARVYQFDRGELFWGTVGVHELPQYTGGQGQPRRQRHAPHLFRPQGPRFHGRQVPA